MAVENTADLSVKELKEQREKLDREIAERVAAEKLDILNQIKEVSQDNGITLDDIVSHWTGKASTRLGAKAKTKYRDPVSGATWSGRGKEPKWIKDKDRTPFEILPELPSDE